MSALQQLTVADEPATWAGLGFAVEGDACVVDGVRIRLCGRDGVAGPASGGHVATSGTRPGRGIVRWSLGGLSSVELDGLPTVRAEERGAAPAAASAGDGARAHPNGVIALDHVVAISPALDRTVAALQAAGLDLRRIREQPTPAGAPRQAFFRLDDVILEVVQAPPEAIERSGGADGPAFFWGLAFQVADLDATVARIGEHVTPPRAAVQPGRRIATLRRSAGLALPVALMTPPGARPPAD